MYKNYRIGNDGELKYDAPSYRVVPKRRSNKITDEWQKRLDGYSPRTHSKEEYRLKKKDLNLE